jgi:hypothetical protein
MTRGFFSASWTRWFGEAAGSNTTRARAYHHGKGITSRTKGGSYAMIIASEAMVVDDRRDDRA